MVCIDKRLLHPALSAEEIYTHQHCSWKRATSETMQLDFCFLKVYASTAAVGQKEIDD